MYNKVAINSFVKFIKSKDGIADKTSLSAITQYQFRLTRDRSVYYGNDFAVRFCTSKNSEFSNTVLSLSMLQKYDKIPFIVCIVTPQANYLVLANSTFLRKISHSSQELRVDNIKGSFNGSDIIRNFEGTENKPQNFEFLFSTHENFTFSENLERLVEATNNIHPTGNRFTPSQEQICCIKQSVERSIEFLASKEYQVLNDDLQTRVNDVASEISIAAFIDNVNLRGRIIEYLITSTDNLRATLINALHKKAPLPQIYTADKLGDYERDFDNYYTATDIKTKILFLSSNPKGYNIDKFLEFLSKKQSIYLIFVVAIDENRKISTKLCSVFDCQILEGTRIIKQWAGRNSRGVTQYNGAALEKVISSSNSKIDEKAANEFIEKCINL